MMVNVLKRSSFERVFSTAAVSLRQWRLVETRKIARQPEYKVGDLRPTYLPKQRKAFPDYKYGESHIFKQSNKGLYGASFVQYGNNIPESKTKTRRRWLPNIVRKSLWSETLNKRISIRMTTKVLRTISKEGGIDNYLTKDKSARIKELGPTGWKLRYKVMQKSEARYNPPHKDARIVENANGEKVKVFYEAIVNDSSLNVIVGRRKLLKFLYPLEKLEQSADAKRLNYKEFVESNADASINDILTKLDRYGFDLSTISV